MPIMHYNYIHKKRKQKKEKKREGSNTFNFLVIFTNVVFMHPPRVVSRSCCFFSSSSFIFKTFKGSSIPTVISGGPGTEHDN